MKTKPEPDVCIKCGATRLYMNTCSWCDEHICVGCDEGEGGYGDDGTGYRSWCGRDKCEDLPVTWKCENCGCENPDERQWCRDCSWTRGMEVPDEPLCCICRRRHPNDDRHPCE